MKKLITLSIGILIGGSLLAGSAASFGKNLSKKEAATEIGIKFFDGTWNEALAKAKEEKKVIFLDAYAAWCGPCKMMTANTFTDESVGTFFNANFINYKMDMEKHTDGPRLSTKYGLRAYPTLYFIGSDENIVHQALGYMKPAELIVVGEAAVEKSK